MSSLFRLPAAIDRAPTPPEKLNDEVKPGGKRRILVVDDNRDSAESLAMLLKRTGNETFVAYDGEEAVEAAASQRPDVILLDIGLPRLNGFDACRRIRAVSVGEERSHHRVDGLGAGRRPPKVCGGRIRRSLGQAG